MKHKKSIVFLLFIAAFVFNAFSFIAAEVDEDDDIPRITKEEVLKIFDQPGVTLIDVRYEKNWKKSDMKIEGFVREHPNELGSLARKYSKDHKLILYCD
jgi:hypothetical protein